MDSWEYVKVLISTADYESCLPGEVLYWVNASDYLVGRFHDGLPLVAGASMIGMEASLVAISSLFRCVKAFDPKASHQECWIRRTGLTPWLHTDPILGLGLSVWG